MSGAAVQEEDFLALVDALQARDTSLSPLSAALVAAVSLEIAGDSRTFSRLLGIEHALVLREISMVSGPDGPLDIVGRDARTQRTHLQLTVKGERLVVSLLDLGSGLSK